MGVTQFRKYGTKTVPKLLEKVNILDIINDVTTGGTGVPLSSEQGKVLDGKITSERTTRQQERLDLINGASAEYDTLKKIEDVIEQVKEDGTATSQETKDYIDGEIAKEVDSRTASDNAIIKTASDNKTELQTNLDNEESARVAAVKVVSDDLTQEISDRQTAITNEADARTNADANEKTARENADTTLQDNIDSEVTRAKEVEGNLQTAITSESDRAKGVEDTLSSAINNERDQRTTSDISHENRLAAIENGLVAGIVWRASLADMDAVDALVEADMVAGWAYYVGAEKDVYVVVNGVEGDYRPDTWTADDATAKSFLKFADFAEVTGMINAEKARATTAESALAGDIQNEIVRAKNAEGTLTTAVEDEKTARESADANLQTSLDNEVTARTADVDAEEDRATGEEARIEGLVSQEVTDRGTAVNNEKTRATDEEARIENLLNSEVTARKDDVDAEEERATNAETIISNNLSAEVTNRKDAVTAEKDSRVEADNALINRLNIVEGADSVEGSVKKALKDSKQWTNDTILTPFVEGIGGGLKVEGDTVTVNHQITNGVNGVVMGEVIVYAGDFVQEAVAVNVSSVSGSEITLAVNASGEFDGCECKVMYFSRALEDTGAGTGGAGTGAAGE